MDPWDNWGMGSITNFESKRCQKKRTWLQRVLPRSISVELAGGLGNQLFLLVAGIYISKQLKVPLKVFVNDILSSSTVNGMGLSSFRFFSEGSSLIHSVKYRPSRMLRFRKILNSGLLRFRISKRVSDSISGYYSPLLVGDDPNIGLIKAGTFVEGYFQSAKYFLDVRDSEGFLGFELQRPSLWFREMLMEIKMAKPISVHIRRGDYLNPENDFIGALSKTYFLEAIKLLRKNSGFKDSEVWIFSNDIPHVKNEFGTDVEGVVRWVEPPKLSSEAESLLLMANSRGLVISNSTFSWWSAAIGQPEKVISPSKWFKSADDPEELIFPYWEKVDSSWL